MTRRVFPPGVFPDVLSVGGFTYFCYCARNVGLVMRRFPDGRPDLASELWVYPFAFTKGYARIAVVAGRVLVAFYRDTPDSSVVVADANTGEIVSPWAIPFNGNNPVCWGPFGAIAVQDHRQYVLVSTFPEEPTDNPIMGSRPGNATGVSRFAATEPRVRLVTDDDFLIPNCREPVFLADGTVVGVGQNGGVAVLLPGATGLKFFEPGVEQFNARGTRQTIDGKLTLAWWDRDARSVTVVCDVTDADLVDAKPDPEPDPLPSVDTVPKVGGPFGFVVYTFNDVAGPDDGLGNIALPIRAKTRTAFLAPVVVPGDRPDLIFARHPETGKQNTVWAIYAGDSSEPGKEVTTEQSIRDTRQLADSVAERGILSYQDSFPIRDSVVALIERHDVGSCLFKRGPTESLPNFLLRARREFNARAKVNGHSIAYYPALNLAQEPAKRAVETFIAFCHLAIDDFWPGFVLFALGRTDVAAELIPYVRAFTAGITGTPRVRVRTETPDMPASLEQPLRDARQRYGATMNSEQCVEMLNRVLWESPDKGWRLLGKDPGQAGGVRYDGKRVSHDFLVHTSGVGIDCLGSAGGPGAGGPSTVQWGDLKPLEDQEADTDRWTEPIKPEDGGEEPGNGDEEPVDLAPVIERLDRIERAVAGVDTELGDLVAAIEKLPAPGGLAEVVRALGEIERRLATIEQKQNRRYSGRVPVLGSVTLTPVD